MERVARWMTTSSSASSRALQRAGLVAEKAHHLAHDGGLLGQREAALGEDGARQRAAVRAALVERDLAPRRARAEPVVVPVHDDAAAGGVRRDVDHLGVGEAGDVVDDGRAQAHADARHLCVAGVDGDDGAGLHESADHGHHALGLNLWRDGRMPGTRGLAAHVDDVGALVEHLEAPSDGRLGVEVLPAVREGVGGHIENAHDSWARERDLVRAAVPGSEVLSEHDFPSRDDSVFVHCTRERTRGAE